MKKALQYAGLCTAIGCIGVFLLVFVYAASVESGAATTIIVTYLFFILLAAAAVTVSYRKTLPVSSQLGLLVLLTLLFSLSFSLSTHINFDGDFMFNYSTAIGFKYEGMAVPGLYNAAFPTTITYPAILSFFMRLVGHERAAHVVMNHSAIVALVIVVYFLLKKKMSGHWALAGGLLVSLHPFLIIYSTIPNAELLFGVLIISSFASLMKALRCTNMKHRIIWAISGAALCGFSGFFRPLSLIFLIAVFLYVFIFSELNIRSKIIIPAIYLAVFLTFSFLSSVIVKSSTGFDAPSSSYGWNLYIGASDSGQWNYEDSAELDSVIDSFETPSEMQAYYAAKGLERYLERGIAGSLLHFVRKLNPWMASAHIADTAVRQFDSSPLYSAGAWGTYYTITAMYDLPIMFFSLAACICMLIRAINGKTHEEVLLALYFIGSVLVLMVLETAPRYTVSYRMIFCVFAIYGAHEVFLRLKYGKSEKRTDPAYS